MLEDVKQQLAVLISQVNAFHHVDNQGDALIIADFHLRLSQCRHRIEKFMNNHLRRGIRSANNIPTVILVGFGSLEVDETLKMWVNVALVSQSVVVEAKHAFDLSATGQEPSPPIDNNTAGKNGEPGAPGLPGGNLLVMCKALQDDGQKLRATQSRGQQGDNGQNGGNGVSGQDAVYDLKMFKDAVKLAIKDGLLSEEQWESAPAVTNGLTVTSKKKDQSNWYGWLGGAPGKKKVKLLKDPEPGKPGQRPGSGGHGGFGGRGGAILVGQLGQNVWESLGFPGENGRPGTPGRAVQDGKASPRLTGTVCQWHSKGGLCGYSADDPKILEPTVTPSPDPSLLEAEPLVGGNRVDAVANPNLERLWVKKKYQNVRDRLEHEFPRCDFADLDLQWGGEAEEQEYTGTRSAATA